MKFLVTFILIGIALQAANAQTHSGYILIGTFEGLPDSTKIYLTDEYDTIQSSLSQNNVVKFTGNLPLNGQFHFIRFDKGLSKVGTKAIFLENKEIFVTGKIGSAEVVVSGSDGHYDYEKVKELQAQWYTKLEPYLVRKSKNDSIIALASWNGDSTSKKLKDAEEDQLLVEKEMAEVGWEFENAIADWCRANPSSLYAPYTIKVSILKPDDTRASQRDLELSKYAFSTINDEARNGYYGRQLSKLIKEAEFFKSIAHEGEMYIPNIPLESENGETVKLHDALKESKVTLIDCWCKPCRAEFPGMKEVYNRYKSKGFNIVGVSSDRDKKKWHNVVKQENLPWTNLIEIGTSLIKAYKIQGIPAYILVDNKGKILAHFAANSAVRNFGGLISSESLPAVLDKYITL